MQWWRDRKGASALLIAGFIAFALVPIMMVAIQAGRWMYTKGELTKAADMAALAAAQEVDMPHLRDTGEVVLLPSAWGVAERFAGMNASYFSSRGIHLHVVGVAVNQRTHEVRVVLEADVSSLFPEYMPQTVRGEGTAKVKAFAR